MRSIRALFHKRVRPRERSPSPPRVYGRPPSAPADQQGPGSAAAAASAGEAANSEAAFPSAAASENAAAAATAAAAEAAAAAGRELSSFGDVSDAAFASAYGSEASVVGPALAAHGDDVHTLPPPYDSAHGGHRGAEQPLPSSPSSSNSASTSFPSSVAAARAREAARAAGVPGFPYTGSSHRSAHNNRRGTGTAVDTAATSSSGSKHQPRVHDFFDVQLIENSVSSQSYQSHTLGAGSTAASRTRRSRPTLQPPFLGGNAGPAGTAALTTATAQELLAPRPPTSPILPTPSEDPMRSVDTPTSPLSPGPIAAVPSASLPVASALERHKLLLAAAAERPPRKGDGMPWLEDEEEDQDRVRPSDAPVMSERDQRFASDRAVAGSVPDPSASPASSRPDPPDLRGHAPREIERVSPRRRSKRFPKTAKAAKSGNLTSRGGGSRSANTRGARSGGARAPPTAPPVDVGEPDLDGGPYLATADLYPPGADEPQVPHRRSYSTPANRPAIPPRDSSGVGPYVTVAGVSARTSGFSPAMHGKRGPSSRQRAYDAMVRQAQRIPPADQLEVEESRAVRDAVDAMYADALQEEARGPAGGLRRVVELLRQNERNPLTVHNISIAVTVLSERDHVTSDAFGNYGAVEAFLQCLSRFQGSPGVILRIASALRCLVSGSRRNAKLLEAFDGPDLLSKTAASPRFESDPLIAVNCLGAIACLTELHLTQSAAADDGYFLGRQGSEAAQDNAARQIIFDVTVAMERHGHRSDTQEAGLCALRTLLARTERKNLDARILSDVVTAASAAFRMHGHESRDIPWLSLGVLCDVDEARDSSFLVELDVACFFQSLRQVIGEVSNLAASRAEFSADSDRIPQSAGTTVAPPRVSKKRDVSGIRQKQGPDTSEYDSSIESGAQLVARALLVAARIGWRSQETRQSVLQAGAVDACLDALRVFCGRRDVLEPTCGLARGLLEWSEARADLSEKDFTVGVLSAIMEVTRA